MAAGRLQLGTPLEAGTILWDGWYDYWDDSAL